MSKKVYLKCGNCGAKSALEEDVALRRCSDGKRLYHYKCEACYFSGPYLTTRSKAYDGFYENGVKERSREEEWKEVHRNRS